MACSSDPSASSSSGGLADASSGGASSGGGSSTSSGGASTSGGIGDAATGVDGSNGGTQPDAGPPPCGKLTTPCPVGSGCSGPADCATNLCLAGKCEQPSPSDGVKDGDETDTDCGGSKAPACADGKGCSAKTDCTSGVCTGDVCQAPSPTDGVKNGDETDTDCGGTKAPKCGDNKGCASTNDCTSQICDGVSKSCTPPTDHDGVQNGGETGVDCGGTTTTKKCAPGQGCSGDIDCTDTRCSTVAPKTCNPPSNTDGLKNGTETDVDCGGANAPACADGAGCAATSDCTSLVCNANVCQVPSPTDGVKNGDESDTDCGGSKAPKCADTKKCVTASDCTSVVCDAVAKTCTPPNDHDGVKNGAETGTDCGGPTTTKKCAPGQGCSATSDCNNTLCSTAAPKTCNAAAGNDGLKNGTETDVDCGGGAPTNAPPCNAGQVCAVDGDCGSSTCGYANVCVPAPSCRPHEGGDTCGAREVGMAGQAHESCCASVALPASAVKVDKYEITAGRMREFIRVVNNNVQGWVAGHRTITQQIPDAMVQYLPTGLSTPSHNIVRCQADGTGCASTAQTFGVYDHLGNTVFMDDRPCANCGQGCWLNTGAGENGHPTYWWPNNTQSNQWGAGNRVFSQQQLDEKSLNCVAQVLLAAFCAWDGGRLPTQAELGGTSGAWGPNSYPWGAAPAYTDTVAGAAGRVPYSWKTDEFLVPMRSSGGAFNLAAYDLNSSNYNPFPNSPAIYEARYVYPMPANPNTNDQAYAIAPPGRIRNDFRSVGPGATDGYYDVGGNLMEAVADPTTCSALNTTTSQCASSSGPTGFCGADGKCYDDANHNTWARVYWVGASFEGHGLSRTGHNLSVMTKYGKQGGRCAR